MKRNLLLALGILLFTVSCGEDQDGEQPTSTITLWHFWSEPNQKAALSSVVEEFEKNTGVSVELTELSWNDGKTKLQAAFSSGTAPDVIELGSDWVAQFSSAGVLMELPNTDGDVGRFVDYTLAPGAWKGRQYAYPWTVDTRVMYINRGLLESAGWQGAITTIEDLAEASEMVLSTGAYGYGANGADRHRLYKKILPLMWSYGEPGAPVIVNSDGAVVLNSPSNVKAFEVYASLARTGLIETQRQLDAAFLQGKVACWNSGSWLLPKIRAAKDLDIEAILMPGTGGNPGVSFAGGEYLAVSAATENSQRSRELVEYLTSGKAALALCQGIPEAGFPADNGMYRSESLMIDPIKSVFASQLEHARMTPVHPNWLDLEAILEDAMVRVLLGELSVEDALEKAQEEAEIVTRARQL